MSLPWRFQEALFAPKIDPALVTAIADDIHRNRSGCDWPRHTVDWLRNRRARDHNVDLPLANNSMAYHLRLLFCLSDYIFARVSKCRCAKRQGYYTCRTSSGPTGQAREPERCSHAASMLDLTQNSRLIEQVSRDYCQRKCSSRSWSKRPLASSLRGPFAATSFS